MSRYFSSFEEAQATIEPYRPYLFAVALKYVRNRQVAKLMVYETIQNALLKWQQFKGNSSVKTWLTRIVINKCFDYGRHQKRHEQEVPFDPSLDRGSKAWWSNPVRAMMNRELRTFIGKTVKGMPPGQRKAFVLYELKGATHEAAARRLRISRQAFNASLCRARERFRQAVEESEFAYIVRQRGRADGARAAG